MRLRQHILESPVNTDGMDEVLNIINRDCKQYVKYCKGCNSLLKRGSMKKMTTDMGRFKARTDRKPKLIDDMWLHDELDEWGLKNWGFRPRSQAMFTSNREHNVRLYGQPYLFFPIGQFDYAWLDRTMQIYRWYDQWKSLWQIEYKKMAKDPATGSWSNDNLILKAKEQAFEIRMVPELETYHTNNLNKYLKGKSDEYGPAECIVHCKEYYLVNANFTQWLMEHLR